MGKDDEELNKILEQDSEKKEHLSKAKNILKRAYPTDPDCWDEDGCSSPKEDNNDRSKAFTQWSTHDGKIFVPTNKTKKKLTPGVYEIKSSPSIGLYFQKVPVKTEGLIRFPETNSDKVVDEITKFWTKEEVFRNYGLTYKRGILLWGPPGSGKSCTLQIIMSDVIKRDGVVIQFGDPGLFLEGMRILRDIQQDTPIVVMMEDIDSILDIYSESQVLNILDGVNEVDRVVFLATTNYPGKLGGRIVNRPSRFDKRFKIPFPSATARKMYLESIMGIQKEHDLDRWVKDTKNFSIAHLKELFIAVIILGDKYEEAIETLKNMREDIKDEDEFQNPLGFVSISEDDDKE